MSRLVVQIDEQDDVAEVKICGQTVVRVTNRAQEYTVDVEILNSEGHQIVLQSFCTEPCCMDLTG